MSLVKRVVNDDGGNSSASAFTLTASGPSVITGNGSVLAAVPVGPYVLSESGPAGYTSSGYTCTGAMIALQTVTLAQGDHAVCTIVNDDKPVDLLVTKSDSGVTAVAGGDPFGYTITVQNIGTRDADLGEAVVVTDELPVGLAWVTFPASCTSAAQVLTCNVDPAQLTAGAVPVAINATVRALASTPAGTLVNKAYVTTSDDPVCLEEGCPPPPCDDIENNNVDCEPTPIRREGAIEIVKVDDVATDAVVMPGDTFSYTLSVRNTGLSSLLPGTTVTDDLPSQLALVSVVGGAGWTCNAADPVTCTFADAIAPGAVTPTIVLAVRVLDNASGAAIVNSAVTTGTVEDCATGSPAARVACGPLTDDDDERTPLTSSADVAIVKQSSVDSVGSGTTFEWTLTVTNQGPGLASNVVVADSLPADVTIVSVTSTQFACTFVGREVTCTKALLTARETGVVTITVSTAATLASGRITNIGRVSADTPDPNLTNNTDEDPVDIVASQAPPSTTIPTPAPVVTVPETGANSGTTASWALLVLGLGVALLMITRRRRPTAS